MPFDLFERIAEERIQEAMGRGEFENLAGMGEPLRGLEGYFATPEHLRVGYSMLKSSGFVPEEVSLRKEIDLLRERVRASRDGAERRQLGSEIQNLQLKYDLLVERYR